MNNKQQKREIKALRQELKKTKKKVDDLKIEVNNLKMGPIEFKEDARDYDVRHPKLEKKIGKILGMDLLGRYQIHPGEDIRDITHLMDEAQIVIGTAINNYNAQ